jgi:carbon storage regulator
MLVLTRKYGEKTHIGDVVVTVVEIENNQVRLGIEAPPDVLILRGELLDRDPGNTRNLKGRTND